MKTLLRAGGVLAAVAFLVLVMGWLAGFFGEKVEPGKIAPHATTVAGERYTVHEVSEPRVEQAPGTVQARSETVVSSRILATISSIPVQAGDTVKQGDTLVVLDARELEARVQQAQQTVVAAQAQVTEARADYERIRSLFQRQVMARAELDRAQATLASREADLTRARRALDEARTAQSYSTITAPIGGRIIDRYADPGDTAVPGTPLVRLYDPSRLRLEANVRESKASTLKPGAKLTARIDALQADFPVTVEEIVPSADPGSRSFLVKATLPPRPDLYPGMFGRLLIPSGSERRIYVPERAVSRVGQLEFVQVAHDGGAVRRYVRTGERNASGEVDVLSGLEPGEQVILPGG